MTVRQLSKELTVEELTAWAAFFEMKKELEDKEMEKAKKADTKTMGSR